VEQGGESNIAAIHGDTMTNIHPHQSMSFATVTGMAVAGCVAVVILFGIIFTVLQVW
jgi:hypothetical protein